VTALAITITENLVDHGIPIAEKVLRTVVVYLAIVILLRIFGKRELAQLNSFDLVVLLLLANVVQNAIIGPDNTLTGGLIGAVALLTVNAVVVRVVRANRRLDELFEGRQTLIVENGKIDESSLTRLGLRRGDVITALRRQGAAHLGQVQQAWIYPGGAILVQLRHDAEQATVGDLARLEAKVDRLLESTQR